MWAYWCGHFHRKMNAFRNVWGGKQADTGFDTDRDAVGGVFAWIWLFKSVANSTYGSVLHTFSAFISAK